MATSLARMSCSRQPRLSHLEIRVLESGALRHAYPLSAAPTCLARNEQYLFYGLIDGRIGDGRVLLLRVQS